MGDLFPQVETFFFIKNEVSEAILPIFTCNSHEIVVLYFVAKILPKIIKHSNIL